MLFRSSRALGFPRLFTLSPGTHTPVSLATDRWPDRLPASASRAAGPEMLRKWVGMRWLARPRQHPQLKGTQKGALLVSGVAERHLAGGRAGGSGPKRDRSERRSIQGNGERGPGQTLKGERRPTHVHALLYCTGAHLVTQSCPTFCDPLDCSLPGSSVHGILQAKNTGVGCHFLLQGIFPTQGSNLGLLPWPAGSLLSEPPGKPQPLFIKCLKCSPGPTAGLQATENSLGWGSLEWGAGL